MTTFEEWTKENWMYISDPADALVIWKAAQAAALPPAPSVADAAGASEGQAFEQWMKGPHDGNFNDQNHRLTPSERVAAYRAWKARDAEIAALRERIAELEARETRADYAQERITYPGDTHLLPNSCPNWPCCPCERCEDCTMGSSGA